MRLRSKTRQELAYARTFMIAGGATVLAAVGALTVVGVPDHIWSPEGGRELLAATLVALLACAVGIFFIGFASRAEHDTVMANPGRVIVNPPSAFVGGFVLALPVGVVLLVRHVLLAIGLAGDLYSPRNVPNPAETMKRFEDLALAHKWNEVTGLLSANARERLAFEGKSLWESLLQDFRLQIPPDQVEAIRWSSEVYGQNLRPFLKSGASTITLLLRVHYRGSRADAVPGSFELPLTLEKHGQLWLIHDWAGGRRDLEKVVWQFAAALRSRDRGDAIRRMLTPAARERWDAAGAAALSGMLGTHLSLPANEASLGYRTLHAWTPTPEAIVPVKHPDSSSGVAGLEIRLQLAQADGQWAIAHWERVTQPAP